MATVYPGAIDTLTQLPHRVDGNTIFATEQNDQIDAIIALETVLGDDTPAAGSVRYLLSDTTGGHDHDGSNSHGIDDIIGALYLSASNAATLSPDGSNNVNNFTISTNTIQRFTTSGTSNNVTGLVAPTGGAGTGRGRFVVIHNVDATNSVIFKNQHASSTAANRFILNADITLGPNQSTIFMYDTTSSRWRCVGGVGGSGGSGGAPTDAAYLIGATSGVSSLTNETLVGSTPNGDLGGTSSTWSAIVIRDLHGDDVQGHHEEDHAIGSAVHTDVSFPTPEPVGASNVIGSVGLAHGDHEHAGASSSVGLTSLTAASGPTASSAADITILSYTLPANTATAGYTVRCDFSALFTNNDGVNRNLQMKIKVGGTTILTVQQTFATGNTNATMMGYLMFTFRDIGASATLIAWGFSGGNSGGGGAPSPVVQVQAQTTTTDVDSTGSLAILLTSANSASSANVSHTIAAASMGLVKS